MSTDNNEMQIKLFLYVVFPLGKTAGEGREKNTYNIACNAGDPGSTPGLGWCPREGNGNPLQYSYLENSMDRKAYWAAVHSVTKSQTGLNDFTVCDFPLRQDYKSSKVYLFSEVSPLLLFILVSS